MSILSTSTVLADTNDEVKRVPRYMDPGTTITFDKDKNLIVLENGEVTEFSKNNKVEIDESKLPIIEEGLIITYDALGNPVVINKDIRKESQINIDVKKININNLNTEMSPQAQVSGSSYGKTTYYYASGKTGASGYTLDEWSAAHMTLPYFKSVRVYDIQSNPNRVAVVIVLDRGAFSSPVVIDIDSKRFQTDFFPLSKGWFDSKLVWY